MVKPREYEPPATAIRTKEKLNNESKVTMYCNPLLYFGISSRRRYLCKQRVSVPLREGLTAYHFR
jgi:hypothetical protein